MLTSKLYNLLFPIPQIKMLPLIIFYSWQSKTDEKKNRYFIREAAQKAIALIKKENKPEYLNIALEVQDSTRGVPGTPDIPATIKQRIRDCDIFLSDITMIKDPDVQADLPEPHYSNNVLLELGFAQSVVDSDRIITVLNNDYGSVKEDHNKVPFDNRQLRGPIEYSYDKAKEQLIQVLKKAIEACIEPAISNRKIKYRPFRSWEELGRKEQWIMCDDFRRNAKTEEIFNAIRSLNGDLRLIGLSGMGKTRVVFEAFRDTPEAAWSNQFLYLNIQDYDIQELRDIWAKVPKDVIVVLDNINGTYLTRLVKWRREAEAGNHIISLYNDPDELQQDALDDVAYIDIKIGSMDEVIEQMIADEKELPDDIARQIREFSDGVPFMTELMLQNFRDKKEDLVKFRDTDIVDRMLPGIDEEERHILRACAIFKQIGFEGDLADEIQFVLTTGCILPQLRGTDEQKLFKFTALKEKCMLLGIFEPRGRFFHIRPRPLSFYLAKEWFKDCDAARMAKVVAAVQDYSRAKQSTLLIEALSDQLRFLAGNQKAQQLFQALLSQGSPFDNAELLNTELGSRLFRTFAEVNPEATAACLWRLLSPMSIQQLQAIDEGRRYLVWALEKICFKPETFDKGAKLMMRLAVAENEQISNNASGVVKDLFHVLLPGTLANLDQRAKVLDWAMEREETKQIGLACLRASLATDHFVYMSGAETFGTQKLEHYTPTYREMKTYWTHNIALLTSAYNAGYREEVSVTVERTVLGLTQSRCFSLIQPLIGTIALTKDWHWEDMRDTFDLITTEYLPILAPEEQAIAIDYQQRLTPTDFVSRVGQVESRFKYRDAASWQEELKIKRAKYQELAQEFIDGKYLSKEIIFNLYTRYDKDTFILSDFGYSLGHCLKGSAEEANSIIDYSILYFLEKDYAQSFRQSAFLFSFLQGYEDYTYAAEAIRTHGCLNYLLFPLFGLSGVKVEDTEELFILVAKGVCEPSHFLQYCHRVNWMEQADDKVITFFDRLIALGPQGQSVVLQITHNRVYWSEQEYSFRFLTLHIDKAIISKAIEPQLDKADYLEYVELSLEKQNAPELALFINNEFVEYFAKAPFRNLPRQEVEKIYRLIFTKYFDVVWPVLSKQLIAEETRIIVLHLKYMFGAMTGGLTGGVMFSANHDEAYIQWCKDYPEYAPWVMAMFTPVFAGEEYHPIVRFLISEFAGNQEVMSTLSANMNSFAWTGSVVPLYEKRKKCFEKLLPESNSVSREWIEGQIERINAQILREKGREDEEDLIRSK